VSLLREPARQAAPHAVQLLAHSAALRTALRRAFLATGGEYVLAAEGTDVAGSGGRTAAIIIDADFPGLNGLGIVRQMAASHPDVPIIVAVADTPEGRALRGDAVERGASAFFLKPDAEHPSGFRKLAEEIVEAVRRARTSRPDRAPSHLSRAPMPVRPRAARVRPEVLVVASSTGGPQALIRLFTLIDPQKVSIPVLIVQHMPAAFTPILAEHLTRATAWRAAEAAHDEAMTPGEIRIAPGGHHLAISGTRGSRRLRLTDDPPVNFCRPSADVLFVTAAESYGGAVLSAILTGMGSDGCEGAKAIVASGGTVYVQDRETSVVWGMPGAAVAAGVATGVYPLDGLAPALLTAMGSH
jgi:two-component system chemotaxis response regulator CheB